MKKRVLVAGLVFALCPTMTTPQSQPARERTAFVLVKAAKVLDVRQGSYLVDGAIWIEGERIKEVGPAAEVQRHAPMNIRVIDLGGATILPGLIDCHTHLMARFAAGENGYLLGLATKSQA